MEILPSEEHKKKVASPDDAPSIGMMKNFTDSIKNLEFNREEFVAIMTHASDWQMIDETTQKKIIEDLDDSAVSKIIQITLSVHVFDGAINLAAGSVGITEILAGNTDLLHSPVMMAYLGKLLASPLFAYAYWGKNKVEKKHLKAATLACPLIGGIAFPALALKDHSDFFKFWRVYLRTKKAYRETLSSQKSSKNKLHSRQKFQEVLQNAITDKFEPAGYREKLLNVIQAQGFELEEVTLPEFVPVEVEEEIVA